MTKRLLGITLGLLLIMSGCSAKASIQEELTAVLGTNTLLTNETKELHSLNKNLLDTNEQLEEQYEQLDEKYEELTKKLADLDNYEQKTNKLKQDHKENIETLNGQIAAMKTDNSSLESKLAGLKQQAADKKAASVASASGTSDKSTSNNSNTGTSSGSSSSSSSSSSSTSTSGSSSTSSAPAKQDCNIKGSNSGIYHTPGSTYYNRTKNVARWFCSVEEAQEAGYRSPKK